MSSSNPSDPRLLLPDWLRDGDVPASAQVAVDPQPAAQPTSVVETVAVETVVIEQFVPAAPVTPYAERLSLDTRLDPGQLVSAADLPKWLGGLERVGLPTAAPVAASLASTAPIRPPVAIEEPEPYEGVDAPEDGVIDVQINGWILVAGAVGLLILLAAALKLYLS